MLFNSLSFALFLPVVFFLYWFTSKGNIKVQNVILLLASYFFYSCWDYRFMFLLLGSITLDYLSGLKIAEVKEKRNKTIWLWISIGINLGFLGVFKYYNFFASSIVESLSYLGITANFGLINVILPVGISFYTFHGLSYVIDIYNDRIKTEYDYINYSVFVSFFPLLVAGPIERATHLLPQIIKKREFDYTKAVDGLRQILWGLFKKIVIADNCAEYANIIFNDSANQSGSTLVLGAFFFTFQIYCDFSGYSDIALGTARLFGIELLQNFNYPYFSRDIAEFWRRWHISLSSWFKDYLYIPLGGSKGGMWMRIRNTFAIFIVSGFWHGANWTFIIWGLLNALFIMPSIIFNTNRNNLQIVAQGKILPTIKEFSAILITFILTMFAWIFFRANSVGHAASYIAGIFNKSILSIPPMFSQKRVLLTIGMVGVLLAIEWLGREEKFAIAKLGLNLKKPIRWAMYYLIILAIMYFAGNEQQFIYFQF